jgi:hypothetical protein
VPVDADVLEQFMGALRDGGFFLARGAVAQHGADDAGARCAGGGRP